MRKFFNDLSIRGKLILLIGGTVCALTAGVLTMVWMQSLRQVRSIVQEQLETNRQLFATAQRSHYRAHAFEAASLARSADVIAALEKRDRPAACAAVARLLKAPRADSRDNHVIDFLSIRLTDSSPLAIVAGDHAVCDPQTLAWPLADVHDAAAGTPVLTTWTSPENGALRLFAAAVPGPSGPLGSFTLGFEEDDGLAQQVKVRAGIDAVVWQEDEKNQARVAGISDASLRAPLVAVLDKQPDLHRPFDFQTGGREYEVAEVLITDTGMIARNPAGLHIALVESVSDHMKPFRVLELYLGAIAAGALFLGVALGFVFSGPIATPLVHLAGAAREIEQGKYEAIEQLRSRNAERLDAADEIGNLSRAFIDMAGGLKQRFAMSKYMSRSALEMLERQGAVNTAGERRWMAVVFSDVRGFTAFSEDRDPPW